VNDGKVLVIGPTDSQARVLDTLLQFLDIEPVRLRDPAQVGASLAGAPQEWLAVIVGKDVIAAHGRALVEQLRAVQQHPPIIYACRESLPAIAAESADLRWLHLELPVKQRRLSALLEELQTLRARARTAAEPGADGRFRPCGSSRAMRAVNRLIEQVAPFDTNVLILGESGTGKELAARHIHEMSGRAAQPFVPVNCGAIPAELLESELFGHEKGAFTGALSTRLGRFEFAEGGTLFLDEIGDMSLQMQVKLLRVLQERSFERVGSNRTIHCNVRIIAATHRNLEAAMLAGTFREDLFYRLNVFPLQMPPLRDRLDDLPQLIEHLAARQARTAGRRVRLSGDALRCLATNQWPGNVRELSNLLERLAILYPDQTIGAADLPERYRGVATGLPVVAPPAPLLLAGSRSTGAPLPQPASESRDGEDEGTDAELPSGGLDLKDHLNSIEVGLIRKALAEADGTVAEAARLLRMRRTTLVEKLRKYRLSA